MKVSPILVIFLVLFFSGCQNDSGVALEVLNKEIFFIPFEDSQFEYKNDGERESAVNVVTYRLKNTTDKKLLFVFDKLHLEPSFPITSAPLYYYGFMGFHIKDKTNSIKQYNVFLPYWENFGDLRDCKAYETEKISQIYAKLGVNKRDLVNVDNFIKNSIVIYPGEIRTFKTVIRLPLVQEINSRTEDPPIYYRLDETDTFELFYFCKAKDMKDLLPQYIKDDLDQNNIEIFDGKLTASPVKLKKR